MLIITKGATPIEKNIIVVDEQGNEYEATYLKRAKGLVKNGRARFINENTICLACPPKEYFEDIKMENKLENKLTEREIFKQIVALQKQLAENNSQSLHRLSDVIDSVYSTENETGNEQVSEICNVFAMREHNLRIMLEFYIKMYENARISDEERKADLIKNAFSEITAKIKSSDLPPDNKSAAFGEITEAIKELLTMILPHSK